MAAPLQIASISQIVDPATRATFNDLIKVLNSPTGIGPGWVTSVTGSGNIASSGGTTPNITFTGILPTANGGTGIAYFTAAGPTVARTYTFPDADASIARIDVGQTFVGIQAFADGTFSGTLGVTGLSTLKRILVNDTGANSLQVSASSAAGIGLLIQNTNTGSGASAYFQIASDGGSIYFQKYSAATGAGAPSHLYSTAGTFNIYTTGADSLNLGTNGTSTRLVINSAGNVSMSGALTVTTNITDSALTAGRVVFAGTAGLLDDDTGLTYSTTTKAFDVGSGSSVAGGVSIAAHNLNTAANSNANFSAESDTGTVNFYAYSSGTAAPYASAAIVASGMIGNMFVRTPAGTTLNLGDTTDPSVIVIDTSRNTTIKNITKLAGSSSGFVGLQGAAAAGSTTYTLPSADGTKSYGLETNAVGTLSWQDVGGRNVVMYGADPTGSADSLSAIQDAIDACGTSGMVYFPPGIYKITNAIRPGSNIKLYGAGYASQILFAGTGGVTIDWIDGGGSGTAYFMLLNEHGNNRAGTIDTNIEICHLRLSYSSGTLYHGICFMNTTGCSVHHCYVDGGPTLSAFIKSSHYVVSNNYATGCTNCCYDNWDGPHHALIADNVAVVGNLGSGIFINGFATDTSTPVNNDCYNMTVTGNVIVAGHTGCLQGIYVSGGNTTSSTRYVTVTGNTIKSEGSNVFQRGIGVGTRADGAAGNCGNYNVVSGNVVTGVYIYDSIYVESDYNSITGNVVTGNSSYNGISVVGDYNMFSGNVLQGNNANFNDTGTGNQNTSNTAGTNTINIVQ